MISSNSFTPIYAAPTVSTTETACIIEMKKAQELDDCYDVALDATKQIIQKDYASKFISKRYKNVYGIGIGFAKKSCEMVSLGNLTHSSVSV